MDILLGILEQGLTYSFLALGVYISYIILDFPDLTVDGSFSLGAAVNISLIILGVNPFISLIISFLAGAVAGFFTGIIHVKLKVRDLLSGLIMQTALYTINLVIAGKANVPIFDEKTIFKNEFSAGIMGGNFSKFNVVFVMIPLVLIIKILLDKFFKTRSGFLLRATGDNPTLVKTMAKDPGNVKILGLSLTNALVSLSGAIVSQEQNFFEISMGVGTMVMGLAAVIIGMKVFERADFLKDSTKVIIGSIIYKAAISLAILIGFSAKSMKLITAAIFLIILVAGNKKPKRR